MGVSSASPSKRTARRLWRLLFIVAGLAFVAPRLPEYRADIVALLREADLSFIPLLVALQVGAYVSDAWLSWVLLRIAGVEKTTLTDNMKAAVLGTLGAQMVPYVGSAALTYYFYRTLQLASGTIIFVTATWALLIWLVAYSSFGASLFFLPSSLIAVLPPYFIEIAIAFLLGLGITLFTLFRHRCRNLRRFAAFVGNTATRVRRPLRWRNAPAEEHAARPRKLTGFVEDFASGLDRFWIKRRQVWLAILAAAGYYAANVTTLFFSFHMFGTQLSFPFVVFGATLASILAVFTLMSASPGVMEMSLSVVFTTLGVPAHVAVLSTIAYRVFSYWLWLPVGAVIFLRMRREERRIGEGDGGW